MAPCTTSTMGRSININSTFSCFENSNMIKIKFSRPETFCTNQSDFTLCTLSLFTQLDCLTVTRCSETAWVEGWCSWTAAPGRAACRRTGCAATRLGRKTYSSGTWERQQRNIGLQNREPKSTDSNLDKVAGQRWCLIKNKKNLPPDSEALNTNPNQLVSTMTVEQSLKRYNKWLHIARRQNLILNKTKLIKINQMEIKMVVSCLQSSDFNFNTKIFFHGLIIHLKIK